MLKSALLQFIGEDEKKVLSKVLRANLEMMKIDEKCKNTIEK